MSPVFDATLGALLEPLLAEPQRAAVLTDVDGTLAPIVERPELAGVPAEARATLAELSGRFGLVGCVSGRSAAEARRLVGLESVAYAGNHGLELLPPGQEEPRLHPSLERPDAAASFVRDLGTETIAAAGLRLEDKGPIQALHWRGADDERGAQARARAIAAEAEAVGLHPHWGRKVLELRPLATVGKHFAVTALLAVAEPRAAIYGGDDTTDLDAFRGLRDLREAGSLDAAVCVAIASAEQPPGLADESDLIVEGPAGWLAVLRALAGEGEPVPYTDLLRLTVLLSGGEATALGTLAALAAGRNDDTLAMLVAAAWWLIALVVGLYLGRPERAADGVRDALARTPTATSLPQEPPTPVALGRLWPIAFSAIAAGALGVFFPGVAAVAAGYALLVALAWRTREAAVLGVEQRDGVRFYVVPGSALRPIELVRTPGLRTSVPE